MSELWKGHFPYIKPTRRVHDSGYRIFEVGYCKLGKGNRIESKHIIGECSDHIYTTYDVLIGRSKSFSINIDLTKDGYIRFFSHQGDLGWDCEAFPVSSMALEIKNWRDRGNTITEEGSDI